MAWRVAAALQLLFGQLSLFPLGFSGAGAQVGPDFELQQPQDKVSVAAGETLTLTCTMSAAGPLGPVKWLKGWGSGNKTVYDQTGTFPRVTRVVSHSNTDFSIRIRDVRPEDAGTYYCVKFNKMVSGVEMFRHGKGTVVSLHGGSAEARQRASAWPGWQLWAASCPSVCGAVQGPPAPPATKSWMQRPHICPASKAARRTMTSTMPISSPCPQPRGTAGPPAQPAPSTPASG
ncbi:tyrosine-protein phosphatase non-receptor type substrate 1-like isoform X4 [Haliaeetus albicilla]|uniref:tyrosine-protein phosphatase non-receptor type substrate 1-like isoform X4 n=1 Tax=Haliaeetus albicilla TaxID=8969 RepID=UPI0037E7C707